MRKQTKLVAVLSAAALLAMGASMTSFAAGWEKDDEGIYHYYDADGEMVTGEWKKDEGKWFYLDDDGNMLTNGWVDDEYYVGDNGAMLVNQWKKTYSDEDQDDPDEDGEHWYYFGSKGKKVVDDTRKINGRTYLFNEDGEMQYGWQQTSTGAYYFGGEDEGWRTENQWLWLERSGLIDVDEDEQDQVLGCTDSDTDMCDDEGWYWFQSSGKIYNGAAKKKINGRYYMFNDHGQMMYEWINNNATNKLGSNAQLDGDSTGASASDMFYYNVVEEGWRGDGWYEIDGAKDMGADNDTDWYFIDDGKVTHANPVTDSLNIYDNDGTEIVTMRKKIKASGNKYFAFNEKGQMLDGLQYIKKDGGFFYFDENGYMKTGKVSAVECDDDDYNFFFTTKNGKNGIGYTGEKDGYLYFNGKRLEADDDYRFYYVDGEVYLVNSKGKIQKANSGSGKEYDDIENEPYAASTDVKVKTHKSGVVETINGTSVNTTAIKDSIKDSTFDVKQYNEASAVTVPFIELYDHIYTYTGVDNTKCDWK
jgi:glucan-binding YG repeat protein